MKHYRFTHTEPILYYDKVLGNFIDNIAITALNNVELISYHIKDYDTPENICYRLYNDSSLSWVLFFFNNIIDPFYEWPLNPNEFRKYIVNKYGEDHLNDTHHWIYNGYIVNSDVDGAKPVTNEQYEIQENDKKRDILIPTTRLMSMFLNNLTYVNE